MASHDAANACVRGCHVAVVRGSGLLGGGCLVVATAAIAELLVAGYCRCPNAQGYLQGGIVEPRRVLVGRQLAPQQLVGEGQQPDGFQVAVSAVGSMPVASAAVCEGVGTPPAAGSRQQALG